ncbi:hypothetical protein EST38_g6032 [Candolleomyces aberdarensis]|uniref:Uncharacterized protein n=1 Tax=Candolleomyces aberdarensis TaxID=2316362 RepID=A0A4V1Q3U7_9AGAR|nr:hypothetical protein EST38_g6032 [Candolleomyces aberdarensis]
MTLKAYQEPVADDQAGQLGEKPGNHVSQSPLTPSRSPNVSWSTSTSPGGRLPQPSSPSPSSRKRKRSHGESSLPQAPRNSKASKLVPGLSDDESPTTHRNGATTLPRKSSRSERENRHSANASRPRRVQGSTEPQPSSAQSEDEDSTFPDFDLDEFAAEIEQHLNSPDEGHGREENEARTLQHRELAHQPATGHLPDTQVESSSASFINREGKATGLQTGYERERLYADSLSTGHVTDSKLSKGKEKAALENYSDEEDYDTNESDEDDEESDSPSSSSHDVAPSASAVQVSDPGRSKDANVGDGNEDNTDKLTGDASSTSALSNTVRDELWCQHGRALELEELNQAADPYRLVKADGLGAVAADVLGKMSKPPPPLYMEDTTKNKEWVDQGQGWKYFLKLRDHSVNKLAPSNGPSSTSFTSVAPARNAARPAVGPSAREIATTSSNATLVPTEECHELHIETSGPLFSVSLHGTIRAPSEITIQCPIAVPVNNIYGQFRFGTFKGIEDLVNTLVWTGCLEFDAGGQRVNNRFILVRHDSPNAPGKWKILKPKSN